MGRLAEQKTEKIVIQAAFIVLMLACTQRGKQCTIHGARIRSTRKLFQDSISGETLQQHDGSRQLREEEERIELAESGLAGNSNQKYAKESADSRELPETSELKNAKEAFSTINRRELLTCPDLNPYLAMSLDTDGPLSDTQTVAVTVSGILDPRNSDWIAVVSPSTSSYKDCPEVAALYLETGDTASMPLTCHYPLKFQFVQNDPEYLPCTKSTDQGNGVKTCNGTVNFRLINIRTDILFVFFTNGFAAPCILTTAGPLKFNTPNSPLYGHLSSIDSSGSSMRVTWVSGDQKPQSVKYNGNTVSSTVSTFAASDMASASPANDFGWHDPGFVHTAVMTGLSPSTQYSYQYGSDAVGWSVSTGFSTPPAPGAGELQFIMYGDMGKKERDGSDEHYENPGALSVIDSLTTEVGQGKTDLVLHIGDISYATGFLAEWDSFLEMITPVASKVSYMTAIGNHERDYPVSGSHYVLTDSGGEQGVPYYTYFPMPSQGNDKPWYSLESGPVHFTIMSTEHDWTSGSEQYNWIKTDLASVDRTKTPWLIFTGHRPMYSSGGSILPSVDSNFPAAIEPLMNDAKVDLALWGHVHNYERMCAVNNGNCAQMPTQVNGVDTYTSSSTAYAAPVHAVIGMSGFTLDTFKSSPADWSLVRVSAFGYARMHATTTQLHFWFVEADGQKISDEFIINKS